MRTLLLCALCTVACGNPIDPFVGTYEIVGFSDTTTLDGQQPKTTALSPDGTKLVITHDSADSKLILLNVLGREITKAWLNLNTNRFETIQRTETSSDATCSYSTIWASGGELKLEGSVFTMRRTGDANATCSSSKYHGTQSQTLQATKDR